MMCMLNAFANFGEIFQLQAFTLDQSQPGWNDEGLRAWLSAREIPFEILKRNTYGVVKEKIPEDRLIALYVRGCGGVIFINMRAIMDLIRWR